MQRSLSVLIALVFLFLTVGCNLNPEADFQKGLEAYEEKDYKTALREWRPLAEQGLDLVAQFNLGQMYRKGEGVPQDDQTAVKWYRLAAEQGLAKAQFDLGVMYYKGRGVLQNHVRAYMWINIAASLGRKTATESRDILAARMILSQIEKI